MFRKVFFIAFFLVGCLEEFPDFEQYFPATYYLKFIDYQGAYYELTPDSCLADSNAVFNLSNYKLTIEFFEFVDTEALCLPQGCHKTVTLVFDAVLDENPNLVNPNYVGTLENRIISCDDFSSYHDYSSCRIIIIQNRIDIYFEDRIVYRYALEV